MKKPESVFNYTLVDSSNEIDQDAYLLDDLGQVEATIKPQNKERKFEHYTKFTHYHSPYIYN